MKRRKRTRRAKPRGLTTGQKLAFMITEVLGELTWHPDKCDAHVVEYWCDRLGIGAPEANEHLIRGGIGLLRAEQFVRDRLREG